MVRGPKGVRVGNFLCVQHTDNNIQLIYNKSVRNVKFGKRADGEILAKISDGSVFTATPDGTLCRVKGG